MTSQIYLTATQKQGYQSKVRENYFYFNCNSFCEPSRQCIVLLALVPITEWVEGWTNKIKEIIKEKSFDTKVLLIRLGS